jgi:hypothetical protein
MGEIKSFEWSYLILSLLGSGWLIVLYMVMKPGYEEVISTCPGCLIVNPNIWLLMALFANMAALLVGFKGDME